MWPLLLGAVDEGKITIEDLFEKFCINPRKRFNLPIDDGSLVAIDRTRQPDTIEIGSKYYGYDPFTKLSREFRLGGRIVDVVAGKSTLDAPVNHVKHLLIPRLSSTAIRHIEKSREN
jgi:hypothetical protein